MLRAWETLHCIQLVKNRHLQPCPPPLFSPISYSSTMAPTAIDLDSSMSPPRRQRSLLTLSLRRPTSPAHLTVCNTSFRLMRSYSQSYSGRSWRGQVTTRHSPTVLPSNAPSPSPKGRDVSWKTPTLSSCLSQASTAKASSPYSTVMRVNMPQSGVARISL